MGVGQRLSGALIDDLVLDSWVWGHWGGVFGYSSMLKFLVLLEHHFHIELYFPIKYIIIIIIIKINLCYKVYK